MTLTSRARINPTARSISRAAGGIAVSLIAAGTLHHPFLTGAQTADKSSWVTAWSTSQQALGDTRITNASVRLIARVTIPGSAVRVRLDNAFGSEAVAIGRAYVGHRARGALLVAGSNRPVTFNGKSDVVIQPGGTVWSDPVPIAVVAQQDLAVTLYIPGTDVGPSQHTNAVVTSYRTVDGSGDLASTESNGPFQATTTSLWWLKAIDVQSTSSAGAVVAFGDSITDGTCSTLDAHDRWEDVLSMRLALEHGGTRAQGRESPDGPRAVLNEGIGGNTVTREGLNPPAASPPGVERLDRDVLSHHGVTHAVLFMGTNDIRRGATAANLMKGMTSIIERVKAKGIKILGATIIPRHTTAPTATNVWAPENTRIKNEVNQWIRMTALFDTVIDFDRVMRDPANPDMMLPPFNCGDGVHPSPLGYFEMGKSIDLGLFRGPR